MRIIIALTLLLAGCDSVVERKVIATRSLQKEISCNYTSYCYACAMGFDGKFNCGFKFTSFCDGRQKARVDINTIYEVRESGKKYQYDSEIVMERLTPCG